METNVKHKIKVGILTLHSQLNYGGVLQAFALQEALKLYNCEPVIIDRWLDKRSEGTNARLDNPKMSFKRQLSFDINRVFMTGRDYIFQRRCKTKLFINKSLILSKEHFSEWSEYNDLHINVDCFIVGSDQVWNYLLGIPRLNFYLLNGAPNIPSISYAASMGVNEIPTDYEQIYHNGWKHFQAISVRENETMNLLNIHGFSSVHVVDPTLLLPRDKWYNLVQSTSNSKAKRLFCYFMANNLDEVLPLLVKYAQSTNSFVDIFFAEFIPLEVYLPIGLERFKTWLKRFIQLKFKNKKLHFHFEASPDEFLQCISSATEAVSDSFHALMFSIIWGINVRIFRPMNKLRKGMFSRIEEFAQYTISGELISDSIESALQSLQNDIPVLFDYKKIDARRNYSEDWLVKQLDKIRNEISFH